MKKSDSNSIRLNRFLAMAGIGSRRKCDEFIKQGRVEVNGKKTIQMAVSVTPGEDTVKFDGKVVEARKQFIYILMNKPLHIVCTVQDEKGRKTVIDLLKIPPTGLVDERLFPVGRLDFNTTGALLITNDGDLTYHLIHPRFEVKKVYRALLDKHIRPIDLHHFQSGLNLDEFKTSPCKIRELRVIDNCSYLEIEMHEGKNRQIRRMFQALGYEVDELERVEFAGLNVSGLKPGEWRELTADEVRKLKKIVARHKENISAPGLNKSLNL
jgi:23S rRNA pseudouridine2605 synthase